MTWALALISLIATVANIHRLQWCFVLWLVTNLSWCVVDARAGIYAQAALHAVYAGLSVYGVVKWRRDG